MSTQAMPEGTIRTGPILGVMLTGAFIAFLNQTLINIALPQIMAHLHISAVTANWLTTIFMLVNGIVIPITAFLMERFTTRQLYITSMGLFTVGTLICGIAPNFAALLIGRVVQAAGAGVLFPLITNAIFALFPVEKRGAAMGLFGVAINFAPAIGPTLSGWIVQTYSWRVLFFVIFPIGLINLFASFFLVKNVSETSRPKLDVLGVILSTLGFGGILYGFATAGSSGWGSPNVVTMFSIGGVSLLLFIWRQLAVKHPILELRVLRYRMFTLTTIINMIVTMAMFAGMILMPIYMQNVRGFSPFLSGLMLLPGGIVMGIMSPITGRLFDKMGAKWLAIPGLLITVITTYALSRLGTNTSFTYITIIFTIRMFGMAILMMPIFTAALNDLPLALNRHGTALINTFRMVAGAVGMAFFVSIMTNQSAKHTEDILQGRYVYITRETERAVAVNQGAVMGINDAFLIATLLTVVALVLSFFIRNKAVAKGAIAAPDFQEKGVLPLENPQPTYKDRVAQPQSVQNNREETVENILGRLFEDQHTKQEFLQVLSRMVKENTPERAAPEQPFHPQPQDVTQSVSEQEQQAGENEKTGSRYGIPQRHSEVSRNPSNPGREERGKRGCSLSGSASPFSGKSSIFGRKGRGHGGCSLPGSTSPYS
ncbi:MDR family MFS transporter [Aneurinibacillus tyrosinisolvens]|uniref:MDR family MFS transporter n=1 Tax=Aneurinibacillus tyrosinisolvens TaxID=1443435 RepID=UPI0009E34426|nr:MDR family MFS transporter [Aneurinibacillus tyrosinisolvens]